ncbi:MAG: histidinol-phosphatase HisJ family protein [Firmicutes bacterium]|nr:histidinol-phosphatase HisJ family protein [Bacillota bacterium]
MMRDYHLHSAFSADSEAPMEEMVRAALQRGLDEICFTEHVDFKHPDMEFALDVPAYLREACRLRAVYGDRILIHTGVELGIEPNNVSDALTFYREHRNYIHFWLGSCHVFDGGDPYDRDFFSHMPAGQVYRDYFEGVLYVAETFPLATSLAHLDYVRRYDPSPDKYRYSDYASLLDRILRTIIQNGTCLELNTSGCRRDNAPNPYWSVAQRYAELGGRLITIGSDAHEPDNVGDRIGETQSQAAKMRLEVFRI